jgi:hypothetical protein
MTVITETAALHELAYKNGTLVDNNGTDFDMTSYSRFKYGYTPTAAIYGYNLCALFIERFRELANSTRRVLITSAPYKYLPTASHGIATAFINALNCYRVKRDLEPAMMLHVVRFKVGTDRYAMATPEERKNIFAQAPRHVDRGLVQDSIVVALDDVRITGATQERVQELLAPCDPFALCYLHVATLVDTEWALANSGIEDLMNKSFATTLDTISDDIEAGEFQLNSRVFRTIMETSNLEALHEFFLMRSDAFLEEMYTGLISGTLEMYGRHKDATRTLERALISRNTPIAQFIYAG